MTQHKKVTKAQHKKQQQMLDQGYYCNLQSWGTSFNPDKYIWLDTKTFPSEFGPFVNMEKLPNGCNNCSVNNCHH
jgi:hypothetical protein